MATRLISRERRVTKWVTKERTDNHYVPILLTELGPVKSMPTELGNKQPLKKLTAFCMETEVVQ